MGNDLKQLGKLEERLKRTADYHRDDRKGRRAKGKKKGKKKNHLRGRGGQVVH